MATDPNYDRYAGFVSLPGPDGKMPRPFRVDENFNVIYKDDESQKIARLGQNHPTRLAQSAIIGWDEAERRLDEERSKTPTRVTVDPSCDTIPAAHDPLVQKTALEALRRSVNDEVAGKAENGFFASEKIFDDGYSLGPIFKSGIPDKMLLDQVRRMKPGLTRSVLNGTYPPSLFVHAHPNNKPPSPTSKNDGLSATELNIPIAAIDRSGTLYCVLPKKN
jgi:hypothetical protein